MLGSDDEGPESMAISKSEEETHFFECKYLSCDKSVNGENFGGTERKGHISEWKTDIHKRQWCHYYYFNPGSLGPFLQ